MHDAKAPQSRPSAVGSSPHSPNGAGGAGPPRNRNRYWSGLPPSLEELEALDPVLETLKGLPYPSRRRVLLAALHMLDQHLEHGLVDEKGGIDPDTLFFIDHNCWPWECSPD